MVKVLRIEILEEVGQIDISIRTHILDMVVEIDSVNVLI